MQKTIYVNDTDQANIERLIAQLKAAGQADHVTDNRGDDSVSALFRYLVQDKLGDNEPPESGGWTMD